MIRGICGERWIRGKEDILERMYDHKVVNVMLGELFLAVYMHDRRIRRSRNGRK